MFKPIAKDIKDQIIHRIKNNGESVVKLASEYSVSSKTIYAWLRNQSVPSVNFLDYARLKRENKILLELVGRLTLDSSLKKN